MWLQEDIRAAAKFIVTYCGDHKEATSNDLNVDISIDLQCLRVVTLLLLATIVVLSQ